MANDGKIEQTVTLSRQEAARWLAALAKAIGEGGEMDVALVGPAVTLKLPDEFQCELEIEPYGEKIELEIEFMWPNPHVATSDTTPSSSVAAADPEA